MKQYRIGIDIGGTNTDAVLVNTKGQILASHKEITTVPLEDGAMRAIDALLRQRNILACEVEAIFFGTTHATNAILEVKELLGVGLIRLAGHRPDCSPCYFWPKALREAVLRAYDVIDGGYECNGESISHFSQDQANFAIQRQLLLGVEAFSVVGTFSPLNDEQELMVKEAIQKIAGRDFPVSLSSEIGGIGFLERENATLLNSALKGVIGRGFANLEQSLRTMGLQAALYMVQNDGSILDIKRAIQMPILTIGAGQTNSFIGGSKVAGFDNAIVIDAGGTSTDIGMVVNGLPKRSCHATQIGGVELHFAMPDVLSLAIGGGSIIKDGKIGPQSVSCRLKEKALSFGGDTLTFTDLGVLLGIFSLPGASKELVTLSKESAKKLLLQVQEQLISCLRMLQAKESKLPIIIVGGAAELIEAALQNSPYEKQAIIPRFAPVSNAYGAALAQVSATIRCILALAKNRDVELEQLKKQALTQAEGNGAERYGLRIAHLEIIPLAYSKEGLAKVSVTALGPRT
jgi:N-methylhydantoinase A/oxoprolinase/acetone carboxylase beta subunit